METGRTQTVFDNNIQEEDVLAEFVVPSVKKPAIVAMLLVLFFSYMLFIVADSAFELRRFSFQPKTIDWQFLLIFLFLPVLGFILFAKGYKPGWIINLFYYIVFVLLGAILIYEEGLKHLTFPLLWRQGILISIPTLVVLLLLQKSVRTFFKISTMMCLITLLVSITIALVMNMLLR